MTAWKRLLTWIALGFVVGGITGAVLALATIRAHHYFDYGMTWLIVDVGARWIGRGALTGAVAGGALWTLATAVSPLLRRVGGWLARRAASVRVSEPRSAEALAVAILLGLGMLAIGWYVLNERYIPYPYSRRYWAFNVGWAVASLVATIVLYRIVAAIPVVDWIRRSGIRATWMTFIPLSLAIVVLNVVHLTRRPKPPEGARSILLLTVDTTRADHLSVYGYSRETTPHLEQLAKQGSLFAYCYSHAPVTSSSFSCIMSGFRPRETSTYGNDPLPLRVNTLAEYFANAGYETAAVVSNFVLRKEKRHAQGFRYYDDAMDSREMVRRTPERIGASTTAAAIEWLQRAPRNRPVFFWVHYQDPHGPYTPPREYQSLFLDESAKGNHLRVTDSVRGSGGIPSYQVLEHHRELGYYVAQYDAEIRYYDECLHQLIQHLRADGWWDGSLVLLTSDHGEGMGEHEYYFAHGDYLYPGQLRVPLMMWGEGVAQDFRDSTLTQSSDIVPTLLAAAGLRASVTLPGRDLLKETGAIAIPPRLVSPESMAFSETFVSDNYKAALTSPSLQLVFDHFNQDHRPYDPQAQIYLDADSLPAGVDVTRIVARLDSLRNRSAARTGSAGADREEAELMKSLGYIN